MGMIIIPCFIVIAIIAVVIFIMAIKACSMEKREDRQMTLAGIIFNGCYCRYSWMVFVRNI